MTAEPTPKPSRLVRWARALKADLALYTLAFRHPDTPWLARAVLLLTLLYALSPIDLIPDVIPVLGYLDDLILIPLGLALARRLISTAVLDDCRRQLAERDSAPKPSWLKRLGAACVIAVWVLVALAIGYVLYN
ncbi:MAG: DUF1232 domain-containing protein [Planctomycetota bacterium]|jgi:uncharacterized membrane protein YkvA (DUF1232 family)|nr:DUF1232 domain-containing protein [Planctomycetota bacterium]